MDSGRVVFLVIGVLIVIAVGQLLAMSGRRYLANAVPPNDSRTTMNAKRESLFTQPPLVTSGESAMLHRGPAGPRDSMP